MKITDDIKYIGVDDHDIDLFEGQYDVPEGMAYNSYIIIDDKIAVMDSVDARFGAEWLGNLAAATDGRAPEYLVVQHMEPDHSANITRFMDSYPDAVMVAPAKAFDMLERFYGFFRRYLLYGPDHTVREHHNRDDDPNHGHPSNRQPRCHTLLQTNVQAETA